jgi:hypothetical protein
MPRSLSLSAEQEAEALRLTEQALDGAREELLEMMRLLVSKPDERILGETEQHVRERAHAIGASALQTALEERKKRGTKDQA